MSYEEGKPQEVIDERFTIIVVIVSIILFLSIAAPIGFFISGIVVLSNLGERQNSIDEWNDYLTNEWSQDYEEFKEVLDEGSIVIVNFTTLNGLQSSLSVKDEKKYTISSFMEDEDDPQLMDYETIYASGNVQFCENCLWDTSEIASFRIMFGGMTSMAVDANIMKEETYDCHCQTCYETCWDEECDTCYDEEGYSYDCRCHEYSYDCNPYDCYCKTCYAYYKLNGWFEGYVETPINSNYFEMSVSRYLLEIYTKVKDSDLNPIPPTAISNIEVSVSVKHRNDPEDKFMSILNANGELPKTASEKKKEGTITFSIGFSWSAINIIAVIIVVIVFIVAGHRYGVCHCFKKKNLIQNIVEEKIQEDYQMETPTQKNSEDNEDSNETTLGYAPTTVEKQPQPQISPYGTSQKIENNEITMVNDSPTQLQSKQQYLQETKKEENYNNNDGIVY